MIYIRTTAYNAEKTISRTIESVLNQTYREFKYFILDNGSTDSTGNIIRKYAQKDTRIVPFFGKINRDYSSNQEFWHLSHKIDDSDFFCVLDADDFYFSTFFEEIKNFMDHYGLDIAACGTEFVDERTKQKVGERLLKENVILETPAEFQLMFSTVHWNLRQVWGKLYRGGAARVRYETELPEWWPRAYGGDTVNVYESVKAVPKIGVYAKILHSYQLSHKSVSHQYIPGRIESDVILHEKAVELLKLKCGEVSEQNLLFLYAVYWNAIKDTIVVVANADLVMEEKLSLLNKILVHPITWKTLQSDLSIYGITQKVKHTLLTEIIDWIANSAKGETYETEVRAVFAVVDRQIMQFMDKECLLFLENNAPEYIAKILLSEYSQVFDVLRDILVHKSEDLHLILFSQNLAAALSNEKEYIYFSKKKIACLIRDGQTEQAAQELREWKELLPQDEELRKLELLFTN